jgi:hypothetical protein
LSSRLALGLAVWTWSADGAPASAGKQTNGWSLQPLVRPAVPAARTAQPGPIHPIDAFIRATLDAEGLAPSPEADRRTLMRRLSFDLTGLPPTPEEADAFAADPDPRAYDRLVDRLLASPRHGERWARHWLDVVHFGETHGYDKDKPRPHAWPYRDYVIRALNEDKPYGRFVQEQLAGDVLFPDTADGLEAPGFIAAGPWDLIGHEELPETKIDGRIARHLDRDDVVANTLNTFCSVTIHCAQCHDHKFDPVTMEDYYSLQAVFAALDRTNREYDTDPAVARQRREWKSREKELVARQKTLEEKIAGLAGSELAELDKRIQAAGESGKGGLRPEFGYHSAIEPRPDAVKWVQADLGQPVALDHVVLAPCHDDFNGIGAGFGFPARFKVELLNDTNDSNAITLKDATGEDFPNPGIAPVRLEAGGRTARFLRVTATKLATRKDDFIFALAELEVFDARGSNVALGATVTALDSIEAPVRWAKKNLVDGIYPARTNQSAAAIAALRAARDALLARVTDAATAGELAATTKALADARTELARLPKPKLAFVGAVHHGSGNFAGTGGNGGKPRAIHVLNRGDVKKPGREAMPGALSCVPALPARFELPAGHGEGERRAALAKWITNPQNPLTWRSVVNRVWQHHFGAGLVDTPNDFGRMGGQPSHPELLDWLAVEFRDGGQSLKQLHRLIVTSATYRQASVPQAGAATARDVANRLLWRQNRRKLEAEAVRDSALFVAGKLDLTMGGPGFQDFVIEKPEHSPHYRYHLADPEDPKTHRRSIYRFTVRSQPQPFMAALDCADPSMLVDKRNQTQTPLQALALLNDPLMVAMARHFATRVEREAGPATDAQVERAFRLALQRAPSAEEQSRLAAHARRHGLASACRLVLNLNEFVFID